MGDLKTKMDNQSLLFLSAIDSLESLEKVCKAIADDAYGEIQRIAMQIDADSNIKRAQLVARADLAISILTRIKNKERP